MTGMRRRTFLKRAVGILALLLPAAPSVARRRIVTDKGIQGYVDCTLPEFWSKVTLENMQGAPMGYQLLRKGELPIPHGATIRVARLEIL